MLARMTLLIQNFMAYFSLGGVGGSLILSQTMIPHGIETGMTGV